MKPISRPVSIAAALFASLAVTVPSAEAALELQVSSKYVGWPGSVTVKVRTTLPGNPIEFRQERLDRRSVGKDSTTAGWSCVTPPSASKPGYQESSRVVARIDNPTPGVWTSVRIRATRLEFTRQLTQYELLSAVFPFVDSLEGCVDPPTRFTRLQAFQSESGLVGTSLTRVL